jgi:hypothetical protein
MSGQHKEIGNLELSGMTQFEERMIVRNHFGLAETMQLQSLQISKDGKPSQKYLL